MIKTNGAKSKKRKWVFDELNWAQVVVIVFFGAMFLALLFGAIGGIIETDFSEVNYFNLLGGVILYLCLMFVVGLGLFLAIYCAGYWESCEANEEADHD